MPEQVARGAVMLNGMSLKADGAAVSEEENEISAVIPREILLFDLAILPLLVALDEISANAIVQMGIT